MNPTDDSFCVENEKRSPGKSVLGVVDAEATGHSALGLEISKQGKSEASLLGKGSMAPPSIDRDGQYLGIVLLKERPYLVIQG